MMKGGHGQTNQLHDINWGALNHASHAPQLMSCNYCVCVCAYNMHMSIPGPCYCVAGRTPSQCSFSLSGWSQTCCTLSSAWRPVSGQCQLQSVLLQTSCQPYGEAGSSCWTDAIKTNRKFVTHDGKELQYTCTDKSLLSTCRPSIKTQLMVWPHTQFL